MRAEVINVDQPIGTPEIVIHHNDQQVNFNVAYYGRNALNKEFDLFEQINAYWSELKPEHQDQIFMLYQRLKTIFDTPSSKQAMLDDLNQASIALLGQHSFDHMRNWIFFRSNISIPNNFGEKFKYDVDTQNTPEQTYVKGEYVDLVAMTLIFRTMMPIWGEYISMMRREHGTRFKEYEAFALVYGAEICHSKAYDKLVVYIDKTISSDRYNHTAIIDGISSEDFPVWVLAKTIIRRLMISDIRGLDQKANIVTFIHAYVSTTARPDDMDNEQKVKNKSSDDDSGDQENKLSSFERYRVRHSISIGEIVEIEHSLSDMKSIAYRLTGQMTDDLFYRSQETCKRLYNQRIMDLQIILLRWVFKPVVSPRGLMYIDNHHIVQCLGVLQAVLWARGHKFLSMLSTAHPMKITEGMVMSSTDSKAAIPKDIIKELDEIYPYQRTSGGKKGGYKTHNLVIESIDRFVNLLSATPWTITADDIMVEEAFGNINRKLAIPYDIKITLANFIIEIGKRTWK